MELGQWYVSRGRIPRRIFWLHYLLPITGVSILAWVLDLVLGLPDVAQGADNGYGPISLVVALALLVPSISSQVTRLHDRGHSAWWLLFVFVPLAGLVVLVVQTWFLRGDDGPNRYGPPADLPVGEPARDLQAERR